MQTAPLPADEAARLDALRACGVLDTVPEAAFDDLAALAAQLCDAPIALVSLVDEKRQWFKAKVGLSATETSRDVAFCAHAILQPELLVVPDAGADQRFSDNPLVRGDPGIRFYAGTPLVTRDGHALGTLCVIDRKPRELTGDQRQALRSLGRHVVAQLELRRQARDLAAEVAERRRAEERVRLVVESAPSGILVVGPRGRIELVNEQVERMFGYGRAELLGQGVELLVPEQLRAGHAAVRQGFEAGPSSRAMGAGRDLHGRRKDGSEFPVEVGLNPISTSGEGQVLCAVVDVTRRKEAERALAEHARLLALSADVGLALTGGADQPDALRLCAEALVRWLDGAFARIWLLEEDEPTLRLRASAGMYTHLDGPHGTVPVGQLKIGLIAAERAPHLTNEVLGDPRVGDQEWARREGMVAFAGYPLIVGDRLVGVMAMFARRALSDQSLQAMAAVASAVAVAVERKRAEERLRARNEDLKAFAYTVSHDLKAPLRGIAGYAQELERRHRASLGERAQFCVSQVITAARNLDRLIEDLLHYSRLDAETPSQSEFDLASLVATLLGDRRHAIDSGGVSVRVEVPPLRMRGWQRGLTQVLSNLVDNALKYGRGANPPLLHVAAQARGEVVRVSVADNGIGFDMRYHDRIFGLFNRLVRAEEFEGTGAGLAIVRKLLDKQRGKIWAESEPGKGATFFVEVPRGCRDDEGPGRDSPGAATAREVGP